MKSNFITALMLGLLFAGGCSNAQQDNSKVLAEVNGSKLTYDYLLNQFPAEYRSSITPDQITKSIEVWIETELLYQDALKNSIDKEQMVKDIIEQKRKDIIAARYVDINISVDQQITDAEIDSAYQVNKQAYTSQETMYHLRHIMLSSAGGADAVYSRLLKGDSFITLVGDYSEDEQSRKANGDIGFIGESNLEPSIIEVLKPLANGQFSKPVQSQSGYYHIFLMEDKISSGTVLKLDDIKEDIMNAVKAGKQQIAYTDLINRLTQKANIVRNPINEPVKQ